jgi:hypothetical protein
MKKVLTILTLLVATTVYGQVGISPTSTFTPTHTLDVDGTLRVSGNVYIGATNGTNNDVYISDDIIDWDDFNYYINMGGLSVMNRLQMRQSTSVIPANTPAISFMNDNNTGIYQSAANIDFGISMNGTSAIQIDANRDVGIGTTNPISKLDIVQAAGNNAGNVTEITSINSGYSAVEGGVNNSNVTFSPVGVLGLGIYSGGADRDNYGVVGQTNNYASTGVLGVRVDDGASDVGWGGLFLDDLGYTGALLNASDLKVKRDVNNVENALAIINDLRAVSYHYNVVKYPNMGFNKELEYGFIAQELDSVLPTLTKVKLLPTSPQRGLHGTSASEREEFMMIDYTRLIPILTQAIKEQQVLIRDLEMRVCDLECVVE